MPVMKMNGWQNLVKPMTLKKALNRQNSMIRYSYDEEKLAALYFADLLHDELARKIIEAAVGSPISAKPPFMFSKTEKQSSDLKIVQSIDLKQR